MDSWRRLFMREADALRFLLREEFSMNVTTTTVMIAGHFSCLAELSEYVNGLAGDQLAEYEGYQIRRVAQFQIIPQSSGLDAALLVELELLPQCGNCGELADAEDMTDLLFLCATCLAAPRLEEQKRAAARNIIAFHETLAEVLMRDGIYIAWDVSQALAAVRSDPCQLSLEGIAAWIEREREHEYSLGLIEGMLANLELDFSAEAHGYSNELLLDLRRMYERSEWLDVLSSARYDAVYDELRRRQIGYAS